MRKTSIAVLALTFSSLAVAGGDPYPSAQCFEQLASDARLKLLEGKVALDAPFERVATTTPAMIRVATLKERAALGVWSELRQECFSLGAAHRASAHPDLPALAGRQFAAQQQLLAELREGRYGFAVFNARALELRQIAHRRQAELLQSDNLHNTTLSR